MSFAIDVCNIQVHLLERGLACVVSASVDMVHDVWTVHVACRCGRATMRDFNGAAVADCDRPSEFIAGAFLADWNCRCLKSSSVDAHGGVSVIVYGDSFVADSPQRRKERAAKLAEAVGFGTWTGGWAFDESDDSLAPTDLSSADMHVVAAGSHCGNASCEKCDPLERIVEGLSVRECLERWTTNIQRNDERWFLRFRLSAPQVQAARDAWSAALRAKVKESGERERNQVRVDIQDIE